MDCSLGLDQGSDETNQSSDEGNHNGNGENFVFLLSLISVHSFGEGSKFCDEVSSRVSKKDVAQKNDGNNKPCQCVSYLLVQVVSVAQNGVSNNLCSVENNDKATETVDDDFDELPSHRNFSKNIGNISSKNDET